MSELIALYFVNHQAALKGNDYIDWEHAAVALPYSHAYLTEHHLRSQLHDLGADARFSCRVISRESEALRFLSAN